MIEEIHRGGVPWHNAPKPRLWLHRHSCWSTYLLPGVERCACGALKYTDGPGSGIWGERGKPRFRRVFTLRAAR